MAKQTSEFEQLRIALLREQEELEAVAESSANAAGTVELDQQRVGRVSRIDAITQQAMGKESERRRKLELRRIAAALQRMEEGEFGYCLTCGDSIAPARLTADPAATQCIDCARKSE